MDEDFDSVHFWTDPQDDDVLDKFFNNNNNTDENQHTTTDTAYQQSSAETTQFPQNQPTDNPPAPSELNQQSTPTTTQQPEPAQTVSMTPIHLHEINGEVVGYIENLGYFPVFISPGLIVTTQAELNAFRDGIIAQVHSTHSQPFGAESPIPANSGTRTSSDDSSEKNNEEQGVDDSLSNRSRVGHKRSRPSETSSSQQPHVQNSDPLSKYIASNFDALIKCAFQNTGALEPTLVGSSWQIEITDLKSLIECTYNASPRMKKADKVEHRIKAIKEYFSNWPQGAKAKNKFTVSIKDKTKPGTDLSAQVEKLLKTFKENSPTNPGGENEFEPSSKRQKTKDHL